MELNTENKEQKNHSKSHNKRKLIASASVTAVVLALVIGLSYAWFFNQSNIATLISIAPPAPIAIKGPHGNSLTSLDLNYTEEDKKGDTVTIRRVISIENDGSKHRIEIVHTTNLQGLTFKLYAANEVSEGTEGILSEDNFKYKYDSTSPIAGSYINAAAESNGYKSAVENSNSEHKWNYGEYENVQKHAEPIYWITSSALEASENNVSSGALEGESTEENTKCLTYYVLEISWIEKTKETDIFYVLAQNE